MSILKPALVASLLAASTVAAASSSEVLMFEFEGGAVRWTSDSDTFRFDETHVVSKVYQYIEGNRFEYVIMAECGEHGGAMRLTSERFGE